MKKICVVTGSRADYGLLYWTLKGIQDSKILDLQLCATGMHLSSEHGLTYKEIEKDGFIIDKKIEILLSSDTDVALAKSIGLGILGFTEALSNLRPDLLLVLGDRYETYSAVVVAMALGIPIAHCHGGESTFGLIDEAIRHSITKMSHLHFVSTESYLQRVEQLGEEPSRIWNVGALGIENIYKLPLYDKKTLEKEIDFNLGDKSMLVTYHPVTLQDQDQGDHLNELFKALDAFPEFKIVFTGSNSDKLGRFIWDRINDYASKDCKRMRCFTSLGQLKYLTLLKHVNVVVGNSSSGILEAPSLKTPSVDIGERQAGRLRAESVLFAENESKSITDKIRKAISEEFQSIVGIVKNPYEGIEPSKKIVEIIEKTKLDNIKMKVFYGMVSK